MLEINTKFMMTVFVEQLLALLRSDNKYVLEFSLAFAVSNILIDCIHYTNKFS